MSNYKNKYLKYKNKYKELKNNKLFGGFHEYDNNNNNIYCLESHSIVPHKNQMIKFLDIVEKKLTDDLTIKENEQKMFIDTEDEKFNKSIKLRNSKRINAIRRKIEEMCIDKDKNYCKDTTTFTMSHGKEYNDLEALYLNKEFKIELKKLFFNMKPITFLSSNFYPIEEPNFIVYIERIINEELFYFEIYKNITNDDVITYYLLTSAYRLVKQGDRPENLKEKIASYPIFDVNDIYTIFDDRKYIIEGYILANNSEKLKNIIKMYYLNIPILFSKWISNFINFRLVPLNLVHHESFKVMDAFIISNNYHIYFNNIYKEIHKLIDDIDQKNHEQINKYFIKCINKNDILEKDISKIVNFILINILPIREQLIDAYNCGKINFLAKDIIKDTSKIFTRKLEDLNKYLNFTRNQIFISIVMELYNEFYNFLILIQNTHNDDLLCILNSIYYYRIYNLENIKHLINYESQMLIDTIYEIYTPLPHIEPDSPLKKLYKSFTLSIPNYYNFKDTDTYCKIDVPKPNGTVKSNWLICGENTILNLINLLILNKSTGKLDFNLLPISTIESLKEFYKKYDTFEKLKSRPVISEYTKILWDIPFPKIIVNGISDPKYNIYYEYDDTISEKGAEIKPSYENICRVLAYLFGLDRELNIYNYKDLIVTSLNINDNTLKIIFEHIRSEYATEMVSNYTYSENSGSININLINLGIITLSSIHSEYKISQSCNKILNKMNYYVSQEPLIINPLHYGYCGIIAIDYIYSYYELTDLFLDFYVVTLVNNMFELYFDNFHIILNYIFDERPLIYRQILAENNAYHNLFKYYENYYPYFSYISNEINNIYNFINKIVLNTNPDDYIFDITSKYTMEIFIECDNLITLPADITKYKKHFNFSQIFAFYNDTLSSFEKFKKIFIKYDFFTCNEPFMISFILNTDIEFFIYHIVQNNPNFENDILNNVMTQLFDRNLIFDSNIEYCVNLILYLLKTGKKSKEDIIKYLNINIYGNYIVKKINIINQITDHIPLTELIQNHDIKWTYLLEDNNSENDDKEKDNGVLKTEITPEILDLLIENKFKNSSYIYPNYYKLYKYSGNEIFYIWHDLLYIYIEPLNTSKINLYFNYTADQIDMINEYLKKYIEFISKKFKKDQDKYCTLLDNLTKILNNVEIEKNSKYYIKILYDLINNYLIKINKK